MAENTTKYRAPALEKGLDIIELLATTPSGLTQKEIADRLGRSLNEIFRMLVCLNERNYITLREGTDRYELTLKMFELSHRHPPIKRLVSRAIPVMNKLALESKQSCHLVVYNAGRLVVVAQVDSPSPMSFSVRLGATVPIAQSSSGRILMAFSEETERRRMEETSGEKLSRQFYDELDHIREAGFVESPSLTIRGVINQSFPVFDHLDKVTATLTTPYIQRLDEPEESQSKNLLLLKKAAEEISLSLKRSNE